MKKDEVIERCTEIHGWMSKDELGWLYDQALVYTKIVEIGVWKGRSTFAMASATRGVVYAVDHWCGSADEIDGVYRQLQTSEGRRLAFAEATNNLWPLIDLGKCVPLRMTSAKASTLILADMVFIDGSHDAISVEMDIRSWLPCSKMICGHDFDAVKNTVAKLLPVVNRGPGSIWFCPSGSTP